MIIAPSLLASNFGRFAAEAERAGRSGADWLHLDIMDGHFVHNISFGPEVVRVARQHCRLFFDVHLMCSRPDILFESFAKSGADRLIVHVELGEKVSGLLWKIRALGLKVGLAINPPTHLEAAQPFLRQIDSLLIMTVNPGFGGQPFIEEMLTKVQLARSWRQKSGLNFHIEVDGGINNQTAAECARAGADAFVSGTALFGKRNLRAAVAKMRAIVEKASDRD